MDSQLAAKSQVNFAVVFELKLTDELFKSNLVLV